MSDAADPDNEFKVSSNIGEQRSAAQDVARIPNFADFVSIYATVPGTSILTVSGTLVQGATFGKKRNPWCNSNLFSVKI